MLISCNKLKSHIKNSEDIDFIKVWDKFTIRTAEIENLTVMGNQFDGVVIAEIIECVDHPDSDHLHILKVDCGEKELVEVVCGAPNVRVGLKIAYVKVGGRINDIEISQRKLRGVLSNGMCCSGRELGISDEHDGILELPIDWEVGKNIKDYLPIDDIIVEIDNKSLTNRPDLWGHFGIAREIAAITNHELKELELKELENNLKDLDIKILDDKLCYRYSGITIDNIKNNITPLEMQIFLYYVGLRSISLIVDLTNYIMLELGQPMHAFDAKKVKNIEVGVAKDGDKFTTLDNIERKLDGNTLMIKNDNEYFGIAGIMGGKDSEIESDTTAIFLESATFNAGVIRKTASRLGLRTEASARYEKSLDPNITDVAIKRFIYLMEKVDNDIKILSNLTDVYPTITKENIINLQKEKLNKYMGFEVDEQLVESILHSLEFTVNNKEKHYEIIAPTFRSTKDIKIEEDIIEEIARFYGYENFSLTPLKLDLYSKELDTVFNQEYDIKRILAEKYNMSEVHSYLWYDQELLKSLNIAKTGVKLLGKSENNILRDDLSFSLLNIVNRNFKYFSSFDIFEIGTKIVKGINKRALSIIIADDEKKLEQNYNKAKDIVKYLYNIYKNKRVELVNSKSVEKYYDASYSKTIIIDDKEIGMINIFTKNIVNKLSKKKCVIAIEIDFDIFTQLKKAEVIIKEISKYPTVNLDYTLIDNNNLKYIDIKDIISKYRVDLINKFELLSIYNNKYTIRFNIGSYEKTLDSNDLLRFKENFITHIRSNGLEIEE